MEIVKNAVVTLECVVHDSDGNVIDDGKNPLVYLHGGYDAIFPLLEEKLHGLNAGEKLNLKLQPDDAFGAYDESLVLVEDRELFPENVEVGMAFERVGDDGEDDMSFRVTDIADNKVVVDGNHPLAGMALVFDIVVREVRMASPEELEHGHVHGPHGHHH
jgi:FKBP-type peptidyl-prolyl cis-trans isomerase SlyD